MADDMAVRRLFWAVQEELITLASPVADRVRNQVSEAVECGDAEAVRLEGNKWSGLIGLNILRLADELEKPPGQTC